MSKYNYYSEMEIWNQQNKTRNTISESLKKSLKHIKTKMDKVAAIVLKIVVHDYVYISIHDKQQVNSYLCSYFVYILPTDQNSSNHYMWSQITTNTALSSLMTMQCMLWSVFAIVVIQLERFSI